MGMIVRMILLVCTLTAIDQRVTCLFECLDGVSRTTTPDVMFLVDGKGFADRIKLRSVFRPCGALFRDGLLRWSQAVPDSPDLLRERFDVTSWTLDIVIGATLEKAG